MYRLEFVALAFSTKSFFRNCLALRVYAFWMTKPKKQKATFYQKPKQNPTEIALFVA